MDCCKYGEYRAHGPYGAGAWEGYGPYAPLPYAPYAPYAHHYHAAHAHDPYGRYYRYDYPTHHMPHAEHAMPMDYGAYASKETRVRRTLARRDQRAHTPAQNLPLPPTPPLECGANGRNPAYCEPQMWPHYQMGIMGNGGGGGWNGANAINGGWAPRNACSRDHTRYSSECRPMKTAPMHCQNQTSQQDGRSTPYAVYEDAPYNRENGARQRNTPEFKPSVAQTEASRALRDRFDRCPAERCSPLEVKRPPPVVPLPAFQQAFGSTEIGKFAEAFSRTEVAVEDASADSFEYESYPDWDSSIEPQWSSQPASREIKCEDNF